MQVFPLELLCKIFEHIKEDFDPNDTKSVDLLLNLRKDKEMAQIIDRSISIWLFISPFVKYEILKSKAILKLRKVTTLFFIITVSEGVFNRSSQGYKQLFNSWPIVFDVNNALGTRKRLNGMKQCMAYNYFVAKFAAHTSHNGHLTRVFTCIARPSKSLDYFWPSFMESKQDFEEQMRLKEYYSIYVYTGRKGLDISGTEIRRIDYQPKIHKTIKFRCKRMFQALKYELYLRPKDWIREIDVFYIKLYSRSPADYNLRVVRWNDRRLFRYTSKPMAVDDKLRSTWWNILKIKGAESASEMILLRRSEYFEMLRLLTDDTLDDW